MSLLAQFVYLQILDGLTTTAFMLQGIGEANPIVRWAMQLAPSAIYGLVAVKIAGIALAVICVKRSRFGLLRVANYFFAGLVVYNLFVIILTSPSLAAVTH